MATERPHNGGQWTDARKKSFIISALRAARWGPKYECLKRAKPRRGVGECAECNKQGPVTLPRKEGNKRRTTNLIADHIVPIIDPAIGFVDWNTWIERAFVEVDCYQALCHECHKTKCDEERVIATARRRQEKL